MGAYGQILSRPGLEARERELAAIGTLAILDAPRQLASHLRGARRTGASREEMHEALEQMTLHGSRACVDRALEILGRLRD